MKTKYVDPINRAKFKAHFTGAMKKGETVSIAFPEPAEGESAFIYIFNGFIAVKLPACFWAEYMQPVFLRESPKPGESKTISGNARRTAQEWLKFWNDLVTPATTPIEPTDYLREKKGALTLRLFNLSGSPLTIDQKFLDLFPWRCFTLKGSLNISPIHAESAGLEVIFLPVRPDADSADQAIIDAL